MDSNVFLRSIASYIFSTKDFREGGCETAIPLSCATPVLNLKNCFKVLLVLSYFSKCCISAFEFRHLENKHRHLGII